MAAIESGARAMPSWYSRQRARVQSIRGPEHRATVLKTIVMGAGVIGATTAYYLARAGHEVTVIDRQADVGLETSFANGGQISVAHPEPWAAPDVPLKLLEWLGKEDAPLIFRLRADPAMWAWGLRFLRNCTGRRRRLNTLRTLRLAAYSREVLTRLREQTGIAFDHRKEGILHVFRDPRELDKAVALVTLRREQGVAQETVDGKGCVRIEPALAAVIESLAGGIYAPDDESGDALLFTQALTRLCAEMGVDFRFRTVIAGLARDGDRVEAVVTDHGRLTADAYVLALGSYSPLLARGLGIRLPIYPVKGYSATLPITELGVVPTVGIIDEARRVVISRLGERLRVAGTAELAGYDARVNPARARAVLAAGLELFPNAGDADGATFWAGLRPMTPDGPPLIGATPYRNLFLNTGHGALGWTLACGSARVVSDLVGGRAADIDLEGLSLARFR